MRLFHKYLRHRLLEILHQQTMTIDGSAIILQQYSGYSEIAPGNSSMKLSETELRQCYDFV